MNEDTREVLYTDVMLQLLSAYLFSDEEGGKDLAIDVMESVRKDEVLSGKGLMEGLVFSSVIHLSLLITLFALVTGRPRREVLEMYALSYQMTRNQVSEMPQVHPEIVNQLVEELDGLL